MTLYYVSAQRGDDTNNGTSPATPWATITKAVGEVAAGDTVYIGPGTYREKPNLATAGTDGNPITWMPDSQVEFVTGDKPGIVRVTGCDVDENATNGYVWGIGASYNTLGDASKGFSQIYIDGNKQNTGDFVLRHAVVGATGTTNIIVNGVVALSVRGFLGIGTVNNCIAICGRDGIVESGEANNCIVVASFAAILDVTACTNCIVVAGYGSYALVSNAINCVALGGYYGFGAPTAETNTKNCLAIGVNRAFHGTGAQSHENSKAVFCTDAFYGNSDTSLMDVSTCYHYCCNGVYRADHTTANATEAKAVLYDFARIAEMLQPLLQFNLNDGDNTADAGDFDIRGIARRLGSGTIDIGAIEHTLSTLDFTNIKTQEPAIKIQRAGMEKFTFWAEGGVEFTKKVWTKWANVTGDKPQIIVDGAHVTRASGTATGDGADWEELSVSATPAADGEVEVYLYARDTGATAVVYFSDLE